MKTAGMKTLIGPRTAGFTYEDFGLLIQLWNLDVPVVALSRLLHLRIAVRRTPLPLEYDGIVLSHGLEFGRWLRERLVAEELA